MSRAKRATKRKDEEEHEGPGDAGSAAGAGAVGDLGIKWTEIGQSEEGVPLLLVADSAQDKGSAKVIGFDIDWTIIRTKSGKTFPTSAADWIFWNDVVPKKLKEKRDEGYRIVFFTNQGGIEKKKSTVKEMETKFTNIVKAVGFPIPVLSSTGNSQYRKPSIDMWDYFEQNLNRGIKVDRKSMIFVGDAAGRPKNWKAGTSKDFSAGDRMFAANIGCEFQTPEEFFLGEAAHPVFDWDALDPKKFYESVKDKKLPELAASKQEIVVLVGQPASGKSTLRKKVFEPKGYVGVNRDTLKTPEKCIKVAQAAVDEGKSVVVDNTNPGPDARAPYIAMAKKKGIPIRAIFIDISPELAAHLNYHRQNLTAGESRRVPGVAYATYRKNFKEPSASEGFASIIKLDFIPNFTDDKERERFLHWNCSD